MKLSTRGRYGLRALVDLAANSTGAPIALGEIATRQKISINYLEQVFLSLRKAGLVKSVKGPQGGYMLVKASKDLYVGEILRALEGELLLVDEVIEADAPLALRNMQLCLQINLWDKINKSINTILNDITLLELVEDYSNQNTDNNIMYYI